MHKHIWSAAVYVFILALIALTATSVLAIWGVVPKETLWKALASGGVLSLFLISLASALRGLRREHKIHDSPKT